MGTLYGTNVMYGTLGSFDTRSTNPNPETYNMGVTSEFKANSSNGLNDGGTYNSVLSIRQWSSGGDWSGGGIHQVGFTSNGNIWHRYSQTSGAWGPWYKLYGSNNGGLITCSSANYVVKSDGTNGVCGIIYDNGTNIGISTASPSRKLEVNGDIKLSSPGYQIYLGENVTTSSKIGINFHTDADPNYWIGKPAGAWTQPLYIGFYTGIKIGANTGYGGTKFYNSSDMSTELMSVGNGDNHVRIQNYCYIGSYGGLNSIPTTYGSLGLLQAKNGYYGILMGQSTSNPNFMWDGSGNGGIYYENWGWLNYTTAWNHYTGFGTTSPAYKLEVAGDVYANGGWFRVSGTNGLYWESYGPGWYCSDGTWLRTYNNASIWANSGTIATNGSFSCGYGGAGGPSGGAIFSGIVGIGTSTPATSYAPGESGVGIFNIHTTSQPGTGYFPVEITNSSTNNAVMGVVQLSASSGYNANEGITYGTYSGLFGLHIASSGGGYGLWAGTNAPSSAWAAYFNSGGIYNAGSWSGPSDRRFKKDIAPMGDSVLTKILLLNPIEYVYNTEEYPSFKGLEGKRFGFIAQELVGVFPEIVDNKKYIPNPKRKSDSPNQPADNVNGYYCVDYMSLIPLLTKAIQEQQKMIEDLKAKNTELEEKVNNHINK